MTSNPPHILIVDDHREVRDALAKYLEKNGMRATSAANAIAMDAALKVGQFDLIVLDVMMPGEDGLSVCRRLRAAGPMPILMLTALGDETDRIVGLEVGADDYLPKPFYQRELNRPGFAGGWFVQRLGDHIECVQVCIERLLCFCGGDVSDGA